MNSIKKIRISPSGSPDSKTTSYISSFVLVRITDVESLINCKECNAQISDAATTCPHCGLPVQNPAVTDSLSAVSPNSNVCPETHLTKAILVTILCCWPIGIPAIVNAAGVSNAFISGHYDMALEKSKNAENWCRYCIIAGVVFWILYVIIIVLCVVAGTL